MRFRIRDGFKLFHNPDEALEYEAGNRAIVPRAQGGDTVALTREELGSLQRQGALGRLEPIDQEAIDVYGNTRPLTAAATMVRKVDQQQPATQVSHRVPFNRGETIGPDDLRSLARGML